MQAQLNLSNLLLSWTAQTRKKRLDQAQKAKSELEADEADLQQKPIQTSVRVLQMSVYSSTLRINGVSVFDSTSNVDLPVWFKWRP